MAGAGGAIAIADPGRGYGSTDDHQANDSIGDVIRRALGMEPGSDQKGEPGQGRRPVSQFGNGRTDQEPPVKEEPPTTTVPEKPTSTRTSPCPEPPKPTEPTEPPGEPAPPQESAGGGGGGIGHLSRFKPPRVPDMQLPGELTPGEPSVPAGPAVLDAGAGAAAVVPLGPAAPIALPVIVSPPIGLGAGAGGSAGPGGTAPGPPPGGPRAVSAEPIIKSIPPANAGSNAAVPASSYRIGYTEYLRTAGLPQVAALAVPGLAGILVLTGAGGMVGYRQAKAGHAVRVGGSARFMR
jgi:hypothetical protein